MMPQKHVEMMAFGHWFLGQLPLDDATYNYGIIKLHIRGTTEDVVAMYKEWDDNKELHIAKLQKAIVGCPDVKNTLEPGVKKTPRAYNRKSKTEAALLSVEEITPEEKKVPIAALGEIALEKKTTRAYKSKEKVATVPSSVEEVSLEVKRIPRAYKRKEKVAAIPSSLEDISLGEGKRTPRAYKRKVKVDLSDEESRFMTSASESNEVLSSVREKVGGTTEEEVIVDESEDENVEENVEESEEENVEENVEESEDESEDEDENVEESEDESEDEDENVDENVEENVSEDEREDVENNEDGKGGSDKVGQDDKVGGNHGSDERVDDEVTRDSSDCEDVCDDESEDEKVSRDSSDCGEHVEVVLDEGTVKSGDEDDDDSCDEIVTHIREINGVEVLQDGDGNLYDRVTHEFIRNIFSDDASKSSN